MGCYLQVEGLTKSVGDRILFADVTFGINEGDKIGLIAKNGTGKTTMLRCLAGIDAPDSGSIVYHNDLRVAILEQIPHLPEHMTVLEACLLDDNPTTRAVKAYIEAIDAADDQAIARASHAIDEVGAWTYQDNLRQMLTQLHITDLSQRIATLSGGQRKRVALARLILSDPQLILLDEPTNHLDIETVEWLEGWLARSRATILMVTHDRYFLDRVCNSIIEIDRRQIYRYDGNYDYYLRRRAERIEAMTAELAKVKNTLRKEQDWMNRQPQARAGKAKYRIDAYHDLKQRSRVRFDEKNVDLEVKSSYIGSKIFDAVGVSKRYGQKVILDDFNYTFARYEKVGIIGVNGVGKSTFIKMLQGEVAPDSGHFDVGETVRFGYYSQDGIKFNEGQRVIDAITDIAEDIVVNGDVRYTPMQFLNHFLFSPADQQKYIHTLSGGERARLHLAAVLMRSPNFLILDEPTNDLDIVTLGILEEYLRSFKGCVIVISHDRFFLDSIVDHLFVFEGDGVVKDFPGGYTDYREWRTEHEKELMAAQRDKQRDTRPATAERASKQRPQKLTFKERREFEALTDEIDRLNAEKASLEQAFASGSDIDDIAAASVRYEQVKQLLDDKELRWLELSERE